MNINKKNNKKNYLYKNIFGKDKGVIELVLSDFEYKNKKLYIQNDYFEDKKGLIIFYAPWCEHCVKISDLIIDLALSNENLFYFGSINSENIEDGNDYLCYYANITKLPTIKYIKNNGLLEDYPHEYTSDNLIYYINTNI
jgi:thiol-disulfide isomerase/thioredoxin